MRTPDLEAPEHVADTSGRRPSASAGRTAMASVARRRFILLVDPEDAFRRKSARVLRSLGHRVVALPDVRQAVPSLTQDIPDLAIVDLNLAQKAGEELFRIVRANPRTEHVPFLFLVRGGHPLEIVRGIPLEESALLMKPFASSRLIERLQPLLTRLDRIDGCGEVPEFAGTFADLDLYDLLGVMERYRRTGKLRLRTTDQRAHASCYFLEGRLAYAHHGDVRGTDVLMELMLWPKGRYQFKSLQPDWMERGEGRLIGAERIGDDAWREASEYLHLVDRGRLNPFPMPRIREMDLSSPSGQPSPGRPAPPVASEGDGDLSETAPVTYDEADRTFELVELADPIDVRPPPPDEEPVVESPPPQRWEAEEQEFELLLTDAWSTVTTDPAFHLPNLPGIADAWMTPSEGWSGGLSRAEAVARLVRRRREPDERENLQQLLIDAQTRIRGALQLGTLGGGIVASTQIDDASRQHLATLTSILLSSKAWRERAPVDGETDQLVVEFQRGYVMLFKVREDVYLLCHCSRDERLGSLMVECQRLAERLSGLTITATMSYPA